MVAFDNNLNRIGYGKGYYDRILRKYVLKNPKITILSQANKKHEPGIPLVSSIIPCYNRREMLERTIQSLIKQTYINQQIIRVII